MKKLLASLLLLALAACQLTPEQRERWQPTIDGAPAVLGKVLTEGPAAVADPAVWSWAAGLVGAIGAAAFGLRKASQTAGTTAVVAQQVQQVRQDVDYAQDLVDKLYDATHRPKA